jgi:hypothetical protein
MDFGDAGQDLALGRRLIAGVGPVQRVGSEGFAGVGLVRRVGSEGFAGVGLVRRVGSVGLADVGRCGAGGVDQRFAAWPGLADR